MKVLICSTIQLVLVTSYKLNLETKVSIKNINNYR